MPKYKLSKVGTYFPEINKRLYQIEYLQDIPDYDIVTGDKGG
jgi:hypothetical protein